MTIKDTLEQRAKSYGGFNEQAEISQDLKSVLRNSYNWDKLPSYMKEALEMDMHKTARILNGDYKHIDSWHDKIGYISLVEKKLKGYGNE